MVSVRFEDLIILFSLKKKKKDTPSNLCKTRQPNMDWSEGKRLREKKYREKEEQTSFFDNATNYWFRRFDGLIPTIIII